MKKKLLHIWHDLYYAMAPESAANFAMTCKEAVAQMQLAESPKKWRNWFRLKLHLSLCQACRHYFHVGRILGQAARRMMDGAGGSIELEELNQELLKKYSRPSSEDSI